VDDKGQSPCSYLSHYFNTVALNKQQF
jgi:hypothetical protein